MEVTTQQLEHCETLLTISVDPKQQKKLLNKAAGKISRQHRIPGFRPGKAPYHVVQRRFGADIIQEQFLKDDANRIVEQGLLEANLKPFGQVQLEKVSLAPLTLTIRVPTAPSIELVDYHSKSYDVPPIEEVTDEDILKVLQNIQDQHASWVPVEKPAALGEVISMTVTQKEGETVLQEDESVDYILDIREEDEDDSGSATDREFMEQLIGLSEGDTKTFDITYPVDYVNTGLANKTITFEIEVSAVKQKEVDPIDDEFAQAIGNKETLDEWRAEIKNDLEKQREYHRDHDLGQSILDELIETAPKIEWPKLLEDQMIENELKRQEQQLLTRNLTLDAYYRMEQTTAEDWREQVRKSVINTIKRSTVVENIANTNNITVSQEEILEQARYLSAMAGQPDLWQRVLNSPESQQHLAVEILSEKIIRHLTAVAKEESSTAEDEENADNNDEATPETDDVSASTETDESNETPSDEASSDNS